MKRREPPACTETGRVRRKRAKPCGAAGATFVAPASFASMSPVKQAVKISPKRGGRPTRHAIQSPIRPVGAKAECENEPENMPEAAAAGAAQEKAVGVSRTQQQQQQQHSSVSPCRISSSRVANISTVLHPPLLTLENFQSGSFHPVRPRRGAAAAAEASTGQLDERAFDRVAMEVLLGRASMAVGAPFTFVSPTIALGVPAGTVCGQGIGKAEEVVGVPWGARPSERQISHESWCREFYWRIVLHQVAKKAGMAKEELARLVGRNSESVLKLVGSGAIRRMRSSGKPRGADKDER